MAKRPAKEQLLAVVTYIPPNCRYRVDNPPKFSRGLNLLFAFAATFTVAPLYYNHPILNKLAESFDVSFTRVSNVPTLMQTGYAVGLLFINPLADRVSRRLLTLSCVAISALLWLGLCITHDFNVFAALSFLCGVTTVTPQIMLPLVGDLAPPERRGAAISFVTAGLQLGVLIARILSGVVTQFTGWRIIYWISLILNGIIFCALWLFMPDYPSKNPGGLSYLGSLYSMLKLLRYPTLIQSSLIGLFMSAVFTLYWTTLTFLLAGSPYDYNSVSIGLFGLIGIAGICLVPLVGRFFIDRYHTHLSIIVGQSIAMTGQIIGAYTGSFTVAGPIIQAFLMDLGMQTTQVSNRMAIYKLDARARNRLNTIYMFTVFLGQIMGTSSGTPVFERFGWRASASMGVAFIGVAMCLLWVRGPGEKGWVGWRGGWDLLHMAQPDEIPQPAPAHNATEERREELSSGSEKDRRSVCGETSEDVKGAVTDMEKGSINKSSTSDEKAEVEGKPDSAA